MIPLRTALVACMLFSSASNWAQESDGAHYHATNMEFVGHVATGTVAADVWAHGTYAYVGSRACGEGVSIIDVANPGESRVVGRLPADPNSTYEDVVVLRVDSEHFHGDLLATGVQPCSLNGAVRGVHLWDVTDPRNPVELSFFKTGNRGSVHELFARQLNNRVFLYLAVPYSERYGEGGDFRIVDATDPQHPVQISDWGVYSKLRLKDSDLHVLGSPVVYCHSVNVSEDGRYAFLSYWDAGYVTLDISDPSNPVFISRAAYNWNEEGNAHSVFPVMSRNLLLAADEDYKIGGASVAVTSPESSVLPSTELTFAKPACGLEPKQTEFIFAGDGCGTLMSDVTDKIAVLGAGRCSYYEKALTAQRGAASGVLIAQSTGLSMDAGREQITIPGATIPLEDFNRLRNNPGIVRGQIGPGVDNTWGYLRLFDIQDVTAPRQVGSFATQNARRCPAEGNAWYTIHNPVVVGDVAYLSWYSDGVRAVDISDPTNPVEIGSFVISTNHSEAEDAKQRSASKRREHVSQAGEPDTFVWGVYVQDGLVYLSDEMTGLWIVRLNRPEDRSTQN